MKDFKLPISIKIFIALICVGIIYSIINSLVTNVATVYNQSVNYTLEYDKLVETQITTYDNYYLAFKEKSNIANINKETFLTVTSIIMQARTDGQNLSWKWVHENQNIPYEEFTAFYKELSSFTSQRFAENNLIELKKQEVVKQHNLLLTTFPTIIYNHFLKLPLLEYKKGFVSEETRKLFN